MARKPERTGTSFNLPADLLDRLHNASRARRGGPTKTQIVIDGLNTVLPKYEKLQGKSGEDVANIPPGEYSGIHPDSPENEALHQMLEVILASEHDRAKSAITRNIEAFSELICTSSGKGMDHEELLQRVSDANRKMREAFEDEGSGAGDGELTNGATPSDTRGGERC